MEQIIKMHLYVTFLLNNWLSLLKNNIMAQESKYAYDEDSVKVIVHWALTAQLPAQIELSESGEYIRCSEVHTGEYTRYKSAFSRPVL